jgi:Replication-relaxation
MKRPALRPDPSSTARRNPGSDAASRVISTANGSVPSQPLSYLTPERLHLISRSLSPLDWQLLAFVHDSRLASGAQLIRAFWHTQDATSNGARRGRRTLKRLADQRVLATLPRQVSGMRGQAGLVYHAGRAGVRLLAARGITGPRVEMPGTLHLAHTLATTELALLLIEANAAGTLELIEQPQQEPACWRTYPALFASERTLKPDLFVRIAAGPDGGQEDRWFIEVDLGSESARTVTRKASLYAEHYRSGSEQRTHGVYPRVVWLTPDQARTEQIELVLARQPAQTSRLFNVASFSDAVAFLAAEARS